MATHAKQAVQGLPNTLRGLVNKLLLPQITPQSIRWSEMDALIERPALYRIASSYSN
jgi:hypothetical protein